MKQAREVALDALTACERQGAWSDGYLKKAIGGAKLDGRDAALATRLCFGVLQNRMLLDFYLSKLCATPLHKLEASIRNLLRLGAYQLLYLNRVPDHAAVSEAVSLARKKAKNPRAAGLVNGVLRSLIRQREAMEPPADLSTRYSHPQPLVELLAGEMGPEELEGVLAADNQAPETVLQGNPLAGDWSQIPAAIQAAGGSCTPHPWLERCFLIAGAGNLERLEIYQKGLCYVQDAASRLAVQCAGVKPGMQVLDSCAAPGGKSFAAAIDMAGQGNLIACDIHEHKLALMEKGAARMGLPCIHTRLQDAREPVPEWEGAMDRVLVDVPCSGLGIIRKKPDIRYKDLTQTEKLPRLQMEILCRQAQYVKPGGVLLYSTCTILRRENQQVVRAFLEQNPDFFPIPLELPGDMGEGDTAMVTLLPGKFETDGFFICKMGRRP